MAVRRALASVLLVTVITVLSTLPVRDAQADETCNSPYTAKLIKGQED